mgnify:CR=1 FL=1
MTANNHIQQSTSVVLIGIGNVDEDGIVDITTGIVEVGIEDASTDVVEVNGMRIIDSGRDVVGGSITVRVDTIGTEVVGTTSSDKVDCTGLEKVVNSSLLTLNDYQ